MVYGYVKMFTQEFATLFSLGLPIILLVQTITMAFSLPLANAAKTLSPKRPTASILGAHTLSSACGVLAINFLFLVFGLLLLFNQDWYQCR